MAYADAHDEPADTDPVYQSFRHAPDARPVKIPTVRHPATGERYVIWSDITDCFPGVVRVQHGEYFVPLLRNQDLYRIKPHGIRCHPGVILDIIYQSGPFQQRQQHSKHSTARARISGRRGEGSHRRTPVQPVSDVSDSDDHGDQRPSSSFSAGSFTLPSSRLRTDVSLENARDDSETLDYAEDQGEEEEEEEDEDEWHSDELELPIQMTEKVRRALHVDESEAGDQQEEDDDSSDSHHEEQPQEEDAREETKAGDRDDDDDAAIVTNGQAETRNRGKVEGQADSDSAVQDSKSQDIPSAGSSSSTAQAHITAEASAIAHRRIEDVLRKRYRWVESVCPKLFIILPNKDVVPPTATESTDLGDVLTLANFRVYFCCDYGGLDCDMRYGQQGYAIKAEKEEYFIQQFGPYIMGVLETLKYGVVFNDVNAPPDQDPMMQIRLSMAMKFLESEGLSSSRGLANGDGSKSSTKRISPLSKQQLSDFMKLLVVEHGAEPHGDMNPCPTPNRDVQWVCQAHWIAMSGPEELNAVQQFIKDAVGSVACEFQASRAARVVIKGPEKARDFYRMADKLKTVCAFRLVLDWDFTPEDERELCEALSRFQAPVVKIVVRPSVTQRVCIQGLAHGYSAVIMQALKNKRIEAFMMGLSKDDRRGPAGHDERKDLEKGFPMLRQDLVRFKRNTKTGKVNISIAVINFDMAMITVRMAVEGLHNLSKFNMFVMEVNDSICVKFIKPGQPGSEIEDTGYRTDNPTGFFKKRRGQDTIKYSCFRAASTLLHSTALVEVRISFVYARDRNTVREILRFNKRLEKLELFNTADDDPSQIYETFKALMANHPRLESLEVTQRQGRPLTSSFKWEHVSDPAKMTVSMNFCETDKVVSMFQRYATSLSRIQIFGITAHDAAVLEKALRPKKGPFKLEHFMMTGAVELEAAALEDLKKIILRADIPEVCVICSVDHNISRERDRQGNSNITSVTSTGPSGFTSTKTTISGITVGTFSLTSNGGISNIQSNSNSSNNNHSISKTQARVTTEAVVRLVDFLVAIRFKITHLNFWGIYTRQILQELEFGWERSAYMPNLTEISVMDGQEGSFLGGWTRNLLYYKSSIGRSAYLKLNPTATVEPLRSLELHKANMTTEDWEVFLKMVDFGEIHTFVVTQSTPMAKSTLVKLAEAVPMGSKLVSFLVDAPGPTWQEMTWLRHEVEKKAKGLWS